MVSARNRHGARRVVLIGDEVRLFQWRKLYTFLALIAQGKRPRMQTWVEEGMIARARHVWPDGISPKAALDALTIETTFHRATPTARKVAARFVTLILQRQEGPPSDDPRDGPILSEPPFRPL